MTPNVTVGGFGRVRLSRREWLGLGVTGLGALAWPAARGDEGGSTRRAPRGKIFTTANLAANGGGGTTSVIAIDPGTGEQSTVLEGCESRPRVSPDGRTLAFTRDDAVWTRSVAGGDEPRRVLELEGATGGSPPVWSPDGKQIVVSLGSHSKDNGPWVFKTVRVNADGTGRTELKVPPEDGVHDWSPDGRWFVTASSRRARIGWELYVMHPDGTGVRQITEGGNPFYTRFSPDGRLVLYTDGTTEERRGVWVVGLDGKGKRKVCATKKDTVVSACFSPDGTRVAVAFRFFNIPQGRADKSMIEVMDLDGKQDALFELPEGSAADMPDWR
jgi:Tol biopolymer transport system component